jgi:hypothetical protein
MNNIKLFSAFLSIAKTKGFIDSYEVEEKNGKALFSYSIKDKSFKLYSDLGMKNVELHNGAEAILLRNPSFTDVVRLVAEKVSLKSGIELSDDLYKVVKDLGWKKKIANAIIYPVGIVSNGIVYEDANGGRYIHQEEGKVSLGFWNLFWDGGEEFSFLAVPKLYNAKGNPDYDNKNFKTEITSSLSNKEVLEYNYGVDNSVESVLSRAYSRVFLSNNFVEKQYLVSGQDVYSMHSILEEKSKDNISWALISNSKNYQAKKAVWSLGRPQSVILSGVNSGSDWKLDFSFRNLVYSNKDANCIMDYSVIMSAKDFEIFKDLVADRKEILTNSNGVFTKLKSTVITDTYLVQKLYKLCNAVGKKQEIKSAQNIKSSIKDTFFVKVVDIDVNTKMPIVEVYKNSEFQIKEKMNVVIAKFKLPEDYTKFNEIKFIDFRI